VAIIIIAILGGIYGGVVTPTEAATVGAVVSFFLVLFKGRMNWEVLKKSLRSTILISSMSYMILAGSSLVTFLFTYTEVPLLLSNFVAQLSISPTLVLILVCLMYLVLGMFIDGISMVVLTIPSVFPLLTQLGYDPVWLGIIIILLIELALISPPVGINLYILQGVSLRASFMEIVAGVIPFAGVIAFMVFLITLFPQIALWLPQTMK
jgi:C4-dicarboxylate transporter DctM subunit